MIIKWVRLFYCNSHAEPSQEIYRHLYMMKPRILVFITVMLLNIILATRDQTTAQVSPAIINRDCAPWDGAAFRIVIPLSDGTIIDISIWQSPDINFPATFSFPDHTGQLGNVLLLRQVGLPEELSGDVFFKQVHQDDSTEGYFELAAQAGQRLAGKFIAEWGNEIVYCG